MEWEEKIKGIAERAVSRAEILPLLNVLVRNPGLSSWNLLMVYSQNPSARYVCGRKAWEAAGRHVKEDVEGVTLLFPKFGLEKGVVEVSFQAVKGYGLEETEGKGLWMPPGDVSFADRITEKTGAVWVLADEDGLQEGHRQGYYDSEMNVFYLAKNCAAEQVPKAALGMYIDYCLFHKGEADPLLRLAVSYVLFEHYHFRHTMVGALFGKLSKYSPEEKLGFLCRVRRIVVGVMGDMEGAFLGFDDVAFLNEFLVSPDKDRIWGVLENAGMGHCGGEITEELLILREKLVHAGEGCIRGLYERRKTQRLFSCPPIRLDGTQGSGKEW